jgi:hypothetical protein
VAAGFGRPALCCDDGRLAVRSTSSSLALRALVKSAANRAGLDRSASELTGLSRAAVALHAALRGDEGLLLVIVPTDAI